MKRSESGRPEGPRDRSERLRELGDEFQKRLESELVDEYRALRADDQRGMSMFFNARVARWATLGLVLALGIVACTTPTTTEVEMGERVSFRLDLNDFQAANGIMKRVGEVADFIGAQPGVDDVSANVAISDEPGQATGELQLILWGQGLDADRVARKVIERFPTLEGAVWTHEPLVGEVRESLAKKLGREVLSLSFDVGGETEEEIRASILAQLAAEGLADGAEVRVSRDGDLTTIGISVDGPVTETQTLIDLQGDIDRVEVPIPEEADQADGAERAESEKIERQ
jgi:hypothetical protein